MPFVYYHLRLKSSTEHERQSLILRSKQKLPFAFRASKRRFKRTTDSHHGFPVAPNLLKQDFTAERPDQKWGADISYVWTREGWLYLAVVIDLFARRVVGWAVSDRLRKQLALEALSKALAIRRPPAGLIHHSDRGSQYCSIDYKAELKKRDIRISMSGKGNCYDIAECSA